MKINSLIRFSISFLLTFLIYLVCLRVNLFGVIFLDGIFGLFLSSLFILVISLYSSFSKEKFSWDKFFNCFFLIINPVFLILSFHLIYPVSIDRSISVYTLSYLRTYFDNEEFDDEDVNKIIKNGFLRGNQASARRVGEQIKVGNFKRLENGNLVLTKRGKSFVDTARIVVDIFNLNDKYIFPEKINYRNF